MHLIGFIIRICNDARSSECQTHIDMGEYVLCFVTNFVLADLKRQNVRLHDYLQPVNRYVNKQVEF